MTTCHMICLFATASLPKGQWMVIGVNPLMHIISGRPLLLHIPLPHIERWEHRLSSIHPAKKNRYSHPLSAWRSLFDRRSFQTTETGSLVTPQDPCMVYLPTFVVFNGKCRWIYYTWILWVTWIWTVLHEQFLEAVGLNGGDLTCDFSPPNRHLNWPTSLTS